MRTRSSAHGAPTFGGDRVPASAGTAVRGTDCLLPAVRSWVAQIRDGVRAAARTTAAPVDVETVADAVATQEGQRLARTAARVLVVELAAARDAGTLAGSTSRDRFADFVERAGSPSGRDDLVHRYPGLGTLLDTMTANATAAATDLLEHLAADRADLVTHLLDGADPGPVVDVRIAAGDRHAGGRAVAVLRFADGRRVVHKPRPVDAQQRFAELVTWLDGHVAGLGLVSARVLPRGGHGWVEHVRHGSCTSAAQVDRFHRRLGALAALLYALDATDMHFENLVACGEHPVLVDVETLFHPAPPAQLVTGPDPARDAVGASVLRTALLPMLLVGRHGALDVSGSGAAGGAGHVDDTVRWDGAGTDLMRLRRGPGTLPPAQNRALLHGRPVDAVEHRDVVLDGFRVAYDAVLAHRAELLGAGPDGGFAGGLLAGFAGTTTRFLPRDTSAYARLLDESTHPDLLRATTDGSGDGTDARRAALTEALADPSQHAYPGLSALVPHEVADLVGGDVPLFTTTASSVDVRAADGTPVGADEGSGADLLGVPGLMAAARKVTALDPLDRRDQEWFVRAAFATVAGGPVGLPVPRTSRRRSAGGPVDPQRLLRQACVVGDQLVASARRHGDRANWPGLQLVDGTWQVLPLAADLGDGYPGVAVFLAELGRVTGVSRYLELAAAAVRPLPDLVAVFAGDPRYASAIGPGVLTGAAGIEAAVCRLATLLDDETLAAAVPAAAATMRTARAATADAAAGSREPVELPPGPAALARSLAEPDVTADALADAARRLLTETADQATTVLDTSLVSGTSGQVEALTALADAAHRHGDDALAADARTGRDHALTRLLTVLDQHGPVCATPHAVPTPGLLTGLAGTGHTLLRAAGPQVPSVLSLGPARSAVPTHVPQPVHPKEVTP